MNHSRRGFLGFLGAAIAGATLDPERLLWEPGKKLISIPTLPDYGYADWMVKEAMDELIRQIEFGSKFDLLYAANYEREFSVGSTVKFPFHQIYR